MAEGITIQIVAGLTKDASTVNASGRVQHIITEKESKTFGIGDSALKAAIAKYFGKAPNDAYLHSPTPGNDLYKAYNWPQIQTVLVVKSATITGITSEPVVIAKTNLNNKSTKKGTFDAKISDKVSNSVENSWSQSDSIDVGQKFKYEVEFLGSGGGGETSFSYSQEWGIENKEKKEITVGSSQGVTIELDPGQSVEAQLTASRGVMKVRIVYQASLIGSTAINYNPPFNGHHFYSLDIVAIMQTSGLPCTKEITEDIEVGYFANAKVELMDSEGALKKSFSAQDQYGHSLQH